MDRPELRPVGARSPWELSSGEWRAFLWFVVALGVASFAGCLGIVKLVYETTE